jgi:hypothetical protein
MLNGLDQETEELLRYRAELGRRLARHGVRDVPSLIETYTRLREALSVVSRQEIEWAAERTRRLTATLETYAAELATLQRLKRSVEF